MLLVVRDALSKTERQNQQCRLLKDWSPDPYQALLAYRTTLVDLTQFYNDDSKLNSKQ